MQDIERTALWVAGMRALETERKDPLFRDPFAHLLAGEEFMEGLRRELASGARMPPAIEVRTRWIDDEIGLGIGRGVRQVVIIAAGMDARAYRLDWPAGARVFELDHHDILQEKQKKLAGLTPRCERHALSVDLQNEWAGLLQQDGYSATDPTIWLVEGLLCYLRPEHVACLLSRVDALSAPGSILLLDVLGRVLLKASSTKLLHELARQFGTDEPETLFSSLAWDVTVQSTAAVGRQLGRWPFPVPPRGAPGVPQSYLVNATKC